MKIDTVRAMDEANLDENRGVVATCGPIHDEVIEVVKRVRAEA